MVMAYNGISQNQSRRARVGMLKHTPQSTEEMVCITIALKPVYNTEDNKSAQNTEALHEKLQTTLDSVTTK